MHFKWKSVIAFYQKPRIIYKTKEEKSEREKKLIETHTSHYQYEFHCPYDRSFPNGNALEQIYIWQYYYPNKWRSGPLTIFESLIPCW